MITGICVIHFNRAISEQINKSQLMFQFELKVVRKTVLE